MNTINVRDGNYPTRAEVREASCAEMAAQAIAAWDAGLYGRALAWVNARADEIQVHPREGKVWLRSRAWPESGGSPRPVTVTAALTGNPAKAALAGHILAIDA